VLELLPLVLGFLLDQLLGDPPGWPHPVRWIGALITHLEKLLRKHFPDPLGGVLLLLIVVIVVGGLTATAAILVARWNEYAGLALSTILIYYGLAARSLARETGSVLEACRAEKWLEARSRLGRIVGRDTADLPPEEIYRACIETVAENTTDGVVAPLFYAALFGPAGMWVYKAINTLDSMVGYKNPRYRRFGTASARADDVANFIPARLTCCIANGTPVKEWAAARLA
jgi:adenosylcobinamide-phosphate synthase